MSERSAVVSQPSGIDKIIEYPAFGSQETVKLSVAIVQQYIAVPTREGDIPDDRECIKFVMLCKARGLNPFEGDAFLIGYKNRAEGNVKWSLITSHQAFLKRAELNPAHDGMQSGVIVKTPEGKLDEREGDLVLDGEVLIGGWAVVYRKGQTVPIRKRLDIAKYRKTYGVWTENPAMMIVKCAEADALRSAYPTLLGGLYLREEMERIGGGIELAPSQIASPSPLFKDTPKPAAQPTPTQPETAAQAPITPTEPTVAPDPKTTPAPAMDQERLDTVKSIKALRRYWIKGFNAIAKNHGIDTDNGVDWEQSETDTLKAILADLNAYVEEQKGKVGK